MRIRRTPDEINPLPDQEEPGTCDPTLTAPPVADGVCAGGQCRIDGIGVQLCERHAASLVGAR